MKLSHLFFIFPVIFISSCISSTPADGPYLSVAGFTQGTTYHITYQCPTKDSINLTPEIDALLHKFDMSLSTYIDSSIISRINRNEPEVKIDDYFKVVYAESKRINELTDGAFDITVGPLINAWGFGPGRKREMSEDVIDSLMLLVGMDKVSLHGRVLIKEHPGTYLDVNAIAQGYSVDIVADLLNDKKIQNYMIEIGGEIRTNGVSQRGNAWRIGIDKPVFGNQIPGQELQNVVNLSGKSLASSGNYRKYYTNEEGQKIVHTLDPKTGYTRMSELLSVTIICDECITADAIATSCMVMGLNGAKNFIDRLEGIEAYFIYSDESGVYFEWSSEGMKELL